MISRGLHKSWLLASRPVTAVGSEPSLFLQWMGRPRCDWQNDVQERIMRLVPIKMLEEKRV